MNNNQISTPVALAIGAVVLVIILALGYKFFLAPPAAPQGNTAAAAQYPGGHAPGAPTAP